MIRKKIQEEYIPALEYAKKETLRVFNKKYTSYYLAGSVHNGEAFLGHSDVDSFVILASPPTEQEKEIIKKIERKIEDDNNIITEFHINLMTSTELRNENYLNKFIFRYNGSLYDGIDVLKEFENDGINIEKPSIEIALGRIGWFKRCLLGLINNDFPDGLFQGGIPNIIKEINVDDLYITRKLAREFIIVEGAYYLMSIEKFVSFDIQDILPPLILQFPEYNDLLVDSERILNNIIEISPLDYRKRLIPFVQDIYDFQNSIRESSNETTVEQANEH